MVLSLVKLLKRVERWKLGPEVARMRHFRCNFAEKCHLRVPAALAGFEFL